MWLRRCRGRTRPGTCCIHHMRLGAMVRAAAFLILCLTIQAAQQVETIAGTGVAGFSGDGGPGVQAQINNPYGLAIGPDGALYFCEIGNHRVRRLDLKIEHHLDRRRAAARRDTRATAGRRSTAVAERALRGPVRQAPATCSSPRCRTTSCGGSTRRPRIISTVAGTGAAGFSGDGGPAAKAQLRQPHSIAFDPQGRLLICDIGNLASAASIWRPARSRPGPAPARRKPTPDGAPIAGTPLNGPRAITVGAGRQSLPGPARGQRGLPHRPRAGKIYHVAGTGETGYDGDGGPAKQARLSGPKGIAWAPRRQPVPGRYREPHHPPHRPEVRHHRHRGRHRPARRRPRWRPAKVPLVTAARHFREQFRDGIYRR